MFFFSLTFDCLNNNDDDNNNNNNNNNSHNNIIIIIIIVIVIVIIIIIIIIIIMPSICLICYNPRTESDLSEKTKTIIIMSKSHFETSNHLLLHCPNF